jgi:hypothetical protein
MATIYVELTRRFNQGRTRCILSSGQAVVLHRLAVMSKDGDWIVREDAEALAHVLGVLEGCGARYRWGAPLDLRWLAGGWSSHFEFAYSGLRVRTDFVSRPPRITPSELASLWAEQERADLPVVDVRRLAELKKTNRERDYAVIGELARLMADPADQMRHSRSARDLAALGREHPQLLSSLTQSRPVLRHAAEGQAALERALDAERRALMHANERRLAAYEAAATHWRAAWVAVEPRTAGLPLRQAHEALVASAQGVLPYEP